MAFAIDNKKIAKNTIALYFRLGITMLISFFTARITLEQLGVDDYGLNNLVGSIVSMMSFLNGSMGTAVQRYFSIEIGKGTENNLKKVFGVGLSLHMIVALLSLLIAEIFAYFFLERMNIPPERLTAAQVVFQISVLTMVLGIINVPYAALLRSREMFSQTAMVEIIQSVLRLAILFMLVVFDYDKLIVFACLNLGVSIYYIAALTFLARRFEESHTHPSWDFSLVKSMLSFISMLVVTVFAQMANVQGVVFLINIFFSLAINAAYAISMQVSNIITAFVASFKQSIVPQTMAAYGAGDLRSMHKLIDTGTKITSILMLFISVPLIFESQYVLELWLKTPPQYAAELVSLVLISVNIQSFTYFHYQGVHASGKILNQQIWMSLSYLLGVGGIYLLFKLGLTFYYAIFINIIVSLFQCGVNLYYAKRCYSYDIAHFLSRTVVPILIVIIITAIVVGSIHHLLPISIWRCLLTTFVSSILIAIGGYKLILDKIEREKVYSMIFTKLRR